MTCQDFINNLSELSESYDYSNEELKRLYNAIRLEPIRWPQVETGVLLGLYTGPGVGLPGATETLGLDLSLGMGLPGISGASNAGGGSIYATPAQCAPLPSLPPSQLAQLPPGLLGLHHAQAYAHAAAAAAAAAVTGPQAYSGHPCVPSSFYSGQPHFQTHLMQQQPNGQPIPGVTNAFYGHPQRMQLQQQPFGQQDGR
ncbi:unnamed protein product [Protopolystoma xenopodis]|uniref:Uncharacterized protein n=1 Tax=Protopolystoma xenopodis TaxID=117903 RepID=A0A448WJA0_9PLAT|nr:unnamed protein product [Protopolystoma xenopodis]